MIIRAEKISRRVDDRWVLRDLSFEARAGEIFGVLGLNGSGKTLLLRSLAGLEALDSGAITVAGEITDLRQECEFVPAAALSSRGGLLRRPGPESPLEKIERIYRSLESGRTFILFDGVFDGLDPVNAEKLRGRIFERASAETNTFIVSGTDRRQIYLTCDRIGILNNGDFIQTGTPEDIYKTPGSTVSASLTGYVNLIRARRLTSSKKDVHEFVTIDGEHRLTAEASDKKRLSPINKDTLLAIRPEEISISFGASFPEDNLVKARVTDVTFLGPVTRVKLDANGLSLLALVLRLVGLEEGEQCMVGIPPDRIKILSE
ncbi:MAG TPA: ATP-binding cassette domain-containing protein [Aridibacter sp.]|nr:ATP-binding cassette domain-containing protein [Aridibacter sp.]